MTDHEVERALGYTPCVCGVLDGTWHSECYRGKTKTQLAAGHKAALLKAKEHLKDRAASAAAAAVASAKPVEQGGDKP